MRADGPSTKTAAADGDPVEAWRRTVLERGLWTAAAVIGFAMMATLGRSPGFRILFLLLPGFLLVVGTLAWRRGSTRARTTGLVFGFFVAMFGASLDRGFLLPNVIAAGVMICVLAATVAGRRGAWLSVLVAGGAWALTGALFVSGMAVPQDDFVDLSQPVNWLRVLGIYLVILIAAVSSVVFMVSRLERALRQTEALSDAVASEAEQKLLALREQQDLQERLYQSQKLESLGRLAGGIAHDFNNVLHVIMTNVELASEAKAEAAERASNLEAAQEAANRAASLVRQLLAFTRHGELERQYIDVGRRVRESIDMVRRLTPDSVELHVELDALELGCWGPPTAVEQILVNLAVNGCQAMPDGGELFIRLTTRSNPALDPEEPFILLSVRDTGCGMSEHHRQRAFEPFFSTKDSTGGTGLGLSLVLALAQRAGGTAEIRTKEGEGTTVEVWLRPGDCDVAPADAPRSRAPRIALRGTVLLADDDDDVRAAVGTMLKRAGLRVLAAEDGREALELFEQHSPTIDVVVTDAVMPKLGGEDLIEQLVARAPQTPCVVCSGYAADMFSEGFFSSPSRVFLAKPFRNQELLTTLASLLGDRQDAVSPPRDEHRHAP